MKISLLDRIFSFGSDDLIKVTFDVSRTGKGIKNKTIVLRTQQIEASCGYAFKKNQEYLVYARGENNDLRVSLCGAKKIEEAKNDLQELGFGAEPTIKGSNDVPFNYNIIIYILILFTLILCIISLIKYKRKIVVLESKK